MKDSKSKESEIEEAHRKACVQGSDFYLDPATGYQVMTAEYLRRQNKCCESGCRHCPYGFSKRAATKK